MIIGSWLRIALAGLMVLGSLPAWAATDEVGKIDKFVRVEMERQKVPGVAIAVIRKGKVVRARGCGYVNVELRVPVSNDTIL
jgi:CubicO group peptidase (beta-lactamase class C family)